jgi:hypothetical protein
MSAVVINTVYRLINLICPGSRKIKIGVHELLLWQCGWVFPAIPESLEMVLTSTDLSSLLQMDFVQSASTHYIYSTGQDTPLQ